MTMATPQPVSCGDLLRRYRIAAGLTQQELAERAGLSARAIGALETGDRRAPRKDTIALLATALGLTPAERTLFAAAARQRSSSAAFSPGDPGVPNHADSATAASPLIRRRSIVPLIGRRQEMIALAQHLASDGPPLFVLAGEPGIGKSGLLEEIAGRAGEQGWTVLSGGCHRRSGQEPFAPFVGALGHFLVSRSPAQQRLDLQGCGWLVRLLPELAEHAIVPAPSWTLPPEQERRLMFAAVARVLANVASPAGTLLVLDDLHWAGGDALDLLGALAREPGSRQLRIVAAYRDTDVGPHDPLSLLLGDLAREDRAAHAGLALLARDEARELLAQLLDGASGAPGDGNAQAGNAQAPSVDAVLDRSSGLPLFLVSWAQELRSGMVAPDVTLTALPWTAAESIRQRVAVLPAAARTVLATAAVAGREVQCTVLLAATVTTGLGEADILAGLEAACRARLLAETTEHAYAFAHDLIRETVMADLGGARRAALHRSIAEALEARPEARGYAERGYAERGYAAELAWHFAEGDEPARALPYALLAGDQAEAAHAHDDAERHYSQVVDLAHAIGSEVHEAEALMRRADVRFLKTRFEDAHTDLLRAAELFQRLGNWERLTWATCQRVKVCDALGKALETLPIVEALLAVLIGITSRASAENAAVRLETVEQRARRATSRLSDQSAARLFLCLTSRMVHLDRFEEVFPLSTATIRHAQRAADKRMESLAHSFRAIAQQATGQLDDAPATLERAWRTAEASADLEAQFVALVWNGALHDFQADPVAAGRSWSQALEALTRLGDSSRANVLRLLLGCNAVVLGDWREARRRCEEARAMATDRDISTGQLAQRALLHLDLLQGNPASSTAGTLADPLILSRLHDPAAASFLIYGLAEVALLAGPAGAVREHIRAVIAGPEASFAGLDKLYVLLAWAEVELMHEEEARAALIQARHVAESRKRRATYVDLWRVEALLALRQGRWADARRALEEALALSRTMPYPWAGAKALYVYGQLHAANGEPERARERYDQALAICHWLGERLYGERIERALVGLADQR
jgi:transcriptional regulator with XRE-family HTH domain/tetratricopeptide (TPR) repeat protein